MADWNPAEFAAKNAAAETTINTLVTQLNGWLQVIDEDSLFKSIHADANAAMYIEYAAKAGRQDMVTGKAVRLAFAVPIGLTVLRFLALGKYEDAVVRPVLAYLMSKGYAPPETGFFLMGARDLIRQMPYAEWEQICGLLLPLPEAEKKVAASPKFNTPEEFFAYQRAQSQARQAGRDDDEDREGIFRRLLKEGEPPKGLPSLGALPVPGMAVPGGLPAPGGLAIPGGLPTPGVNGPVPAPAPPLPVAQQPDTGGLAAALAARMAATQPPPPAAVPVRQRLEALLQDPAASVGARQLLDALNCTPPIVSDEEAEAMAREFKLPTFA